MHEKLTSQLRSTIVKIYNKQKYTLYGAYVSLDLVASLCKVYLAQHFIPPSKTQPGRCLLLRQAFPVHP